MSRGSILASITRSVSSARLAQDAAPLDADRYEYYPPLHFDQIRHHPLCPAFLLKYAKQNYSEENLLCFNAIEAFSRVSDVGEKEAAAKEIWNEFFKDNAPMEVTMDHRTKRALQENILGNAKCELARVFDDAREILHKVVCNDIYSRFIKSPRYRSMLCSLLLELGPLLKNGQLALTPFILAGNPVVVALFHKFLASERPDDVPKLAPLLQQQQLDDIKVPQELQDLMQASVTQFQKSEAGTRLARDVKDVRTLTDNRKSHRRLPRKRSRSRENGADPPSGHGGGSQSRVLSRKDSKDPQSSNNDMPELTHARIFADTRLRDLFVTFCKKEHSEENCMFYLAVEEFRELSDDVLLAKAKLLVRDFIQDGAPYQLPLDSASKGRILDYVVPSPQRRKSDFSSIVPMSPVSSPREMPGAIAPGPGSVNNGVMGVLGGGVGPQDAAAAAPLLLDMERLRSLFDPAQHAVVTHMADSRARFSRSPALLKMLTGEAAGSKSRAGSGRSRIACCCSTRQPSNNTT